MIQLGERCGSLLPWLGSYGFLALERLLNLKCAQKLGLKKLDPFRPFFMQFTMEADEETFFQVVEEKKK